MRALSSIDLHYLISEMQVLVNSKIDKIYNPRKEEIIISFHVTGKGKVILRIISGKYIFLSESKDKYGDPSGFCMYLRKKLGNARLREISQVGSERIVKMIFETKDSKYNFYVELFGKGNIVLTNEENKILNALEQKKWKERIIKKSEEYVFPRKEFNIFTIAKQEFKELVNNGEELVFTLAKTMGLGSLYAEEICSISEINKNIKKIADKDVDILFKSFNKIRKGKINTTIIMEGENIKDIIPIKLEHYKDGDKIRTLNSAYDKYYVNELSRKNEFVSVHQKEIDRMAKIISQQNDQVKKLEKKVKDSQEMGEKIYEKYKIVEEVLTEINKAKEKLSYKEINEKLKGHKIIKIVDGKNKKITVEL